MTPRIRGGRRAPGIRRQRWLRQIALAGFVTGCLGVVGLLLPSVAHGQTDALLTYGVTASGWAIQPYAVNDGYLNVPLDEAAPRVYVNIDGSPSAVAQAAYFYPGSATNGVLATQGVSYKVPSGVTAEYSPGASGASNSASSQVGTINDGVATQLGAGTEAAQASEAYAMAQAALASYQFAPPPGVVPTVGTLPSLTPTVPAVPGVPGVPTLPPLPGGSTPTATPGGAPAATPTPTAPGAKPTATTCLLGIICPHASSGPAALTKHVAAAPPSTGIQLPDLFEQQLLTALRVAELTNPNLLAMASNRLPALDPTLPLASADAAAQTVAQANDNGAFVTVDTRATHVQLFQGLITFASIESTLKATAPATPDQGSGTITTHISGAAIAGIPVTIDANGAQIDCQGSTQPPCVGNGSGTIVQTLSSALNQALTAAGLKVTLESNTTYHDVEKWQGSGGGVEVTGTIPGTNGVSPSHIDFSLSHVTATLYVVPNTTSSSGGGSSEFSGGGAGCPDCSGFGVISSIFGSPGTPGSSGHRGSGIFSLPGSLSSGELLALLAVVQGFSTATVAAVASNAAAAQKAAQPIVEEESQ